MQARAREAKAAEAKADTASQVSPSAMAGGILKRKFDIDKRRDLKQGNFRIKNKNKHIVTYFENSNVAIVMHVF